MGKKIERKGKKGKGPAGEIEGRLGMYRSRPPSSSREEREKRGERKGK